MALILKQKSEGIGCTNTQGVAGRTVLMHGSDGTNVQFTCSATRTSDLQRSLIIRTAMHHHNLFTTRTQVRIHCRLLALQGVKTLQTFKCVCFLSFLILFHNQLSRTPHLRCSKKKKKKKSATFLYVGDHCIVNEHL